MAGDWIKMRVDLVDDPQVFKLAKLVGLDRFSVVGRLHTFWSWADKFSVDGYVDGACSVDIDEVVRLPDFSVALQTIGWLALDEKGATLPKFETHNDSSAKSRTLKSARQAKWRAKKAAEEAEKSASLSTLSETPTVDVYTSTREEKRREEKSKKKGAKAPLSADNLPTWMQQLVKLYHEILPELPGVRVMDAGREQSLRDFRDWVLHSKKPDGSPRATTDEELLAWVRDYFERARHNDFIMGRGPRSPEHKNWRCSIEFLLSAKGVKKVVEETTVETA